MRGARLVIALIVALFGIISYYSTSTDNPVTGEKQRVKLTPEEEIALGRNLAPQMAAQFGGLSSSPLRERVKQVGERIVARSAAAKTPYQYGFHLLADRRTVNAFALPGGQIFITEALLGLLQTEDELAAVLGHEIGHVLARHSAEQLAKQQLTQNLIGAVVIGSGGGYDTAQLAQMVGSLINMKHGRNDELESDSLGVRLVSEAGYDPTAMIAVMQALEKASGGSRQPEFATTHPSPANRIEKIQEALKTMGK
ncbi:MAG: M48 family metalloprotease [Burkholderiales bacterium]